MRGGRYCERLRSLQFHGDGYKDGRVFEVWGIDAKDRGIYEFNIDVVLQQDEEPQRTVRITKKPIAVGFFEIPQKTHPDYKFLHDLNLARGGLMQQSLGLK